MWWRGAAAAVLLAAAPWGCDGLSTGTPYYIYNARPYCLENNYFWISNNPGKCTSFNTPKLDRYLTTWTLEATGGPPGEFYLRHERVCANGNTYLNAHTDCVSKTTTMTPNDQTPEEKFLIQPAGPDTYTIQSQLDCSGTFKLLAARALDPGMCTCTEYGEQIGGCPPNYEQALMLGPSEAGYREWFFVEPGSPTRAPMPRLPTESPSLPFPTSAPPSASPVLERTVTVTVPTQFPTTPPTHSPTNGPSARPTGPTSEPTEAPTAPTTAPTQGPSRGPRAPCPGDGDLVCSPEPMFCVPLGQFDWTCACPAGYRCDECLGTCSSSCLNSTDLLGRRAQPLEFAYPHSCVEVPTYSPTTLGPTAAPASLPPLALPRLPTVLPSSLPRQPSAAPTGTPLRRTADPAPATVPPLPSLPPAAPRYRPDFADVGHAAVSLVLPPPSAGLAEWVESLRCLLAETVATFFAGPNLLLACDTRSIVVLGVTEDRGAGTVTVGVILYEFGVHSIANMQARMAAALADPASRLRVVHPQVQGQVATYPAALIFQVAQPHAREERRAKLERGIADAIAAATSFRPGKDSVVAVYDEIQRAYRLHISTASWPAAVDVSEALAAVYLIGDALRPIRVSYEYPVVGLGFDEAALAAVAGTGSTEEKTLLRRLEAWFERELGVDGKEGGVLVDSLDSGGAFRVHVVLRQNLDHHGITDSFMHGTGEPPVGIDAYLVPGQSFSVWRDQVLVHISGVPPFWPPPRPEPMLDALTIDLVEMMLPQSACPFGYEECWPARSGAHHQRGDGVALARVSFLVPKGGREALHVTNALLHRFSSALTDGGLHPYETARLIAEDTVSLPRIDSAHPSACAGVTHARLSAWRPVFGIGVWDAAAANAVFKPSVTSPSVEVRGLKPGLRVVEWTVVDERAVIAVHVGDPPKATVVNPKTLVMSNETSTFYLSAEPPGFAQQGMWIPVDTPAVPTQPLSYITTLEGLRNGQNTFIWEVTSSVCSGRSVATAVVEMVAVCPQGLCGGHGDCRIFEGGRKCECHRTPEYGFWARAPSAPIDSPCVVCAAGYSGDICTVRVCDDQSCNPARGRCEGNTCVCSEMFTGMTCSECSERFEGPECGKCATGWYTPRPSVGAPLPKLCSVYCDPWLTCNAQGSTPDQFCLEDGSCECGARRTGPSCERCNPPFFGRDCLSECVAAVTCSGHGCCIGMPGCSASSVGADPCACYQSAERGRWVTSGTGVSCDACSAGYGPDNNCTVSQAPSCVMGSSCMRGECLTGPSGSCTCSKGWSGATCAVCAQDAEGGMYTGAECQSCSVGWWGENCTARCDCVDEHSSGCDKDTGGCVCDQSYTTGWWGGDRCDRCCSVADGCDQNYVGTGCSTTCTDCSGHGVCSSTGCECYKGRTGYWTGATCRECARDDVDGHWGGEGCDVCVPGFYPVGLCLRECHPETTCNAHGTCNSDGLCVCAGRFAGAACDRCQPGYNLPNCSLLDTQTPCTANITAQYLPSRADIDILFSLPVMAPLGPMDCRELLSSELHAALGGADASCWFQSSTRAHINLAPPEPPALAPLPGSEFRLRRVLWLKGMPLCGPIEAVTVLLDAAETPVAPSGAITGPSELGFCDTARFSAVTNVKTAGRLFTWAIEDANAEAAAAAALAVGHETLLVRGSWLDLATAARVVLTIRDGFGATAVVTKSVSLNTKARRQVVHASSPVITADFTQDIELGVRVLLPRLSCGQPVHPAPVMWTSPSHPGVFSQPFVGTTMTIPAGTLVSDALFKQGTTVEDSKPFVFRCGDVVGSSFADFEVYPLRVNMLCSMSSYSGGIYPSKPLPLRVDLWDAALVNATPTVRWGCRVRNQFGVDECTFAPEPVAAGEMAFQMVPQNVNAGDVVMLEGVVRKGSRVCVVSRDIEVGSEETALPVDIVSSAKMPPMVHMWTPQTSIRFDPRVEDAAAVDSVRWTCTSGNLNLSDTAVSIVPNGPPLVLSGKDLLPSSVYEFEAVVVSGSRSGAAKVTLRTTGTPSGGGLSATPEVVVAPFGRVTLRATNWAPVGNVGDLRYMFFRRLRSGSRKPLTDWTASPELDPMVDFPEEESDAQEVTFGVAVRDTVYFSTREALVSIIVVAGNTRVGGLSAFFDASSASTVQDTAATQNAAGVALTSRLHGGLSCEDLLSEMTAVLALPSNQEQRFRHAGLVQTAAACTLNVSTLPLQSKFESLQRLISLAEVSIFSSTLLSSTVNRRAQELDEALPQLSPFFTDVASGGNLVDLVGFSAAMLQEQSAALPTLSVAFRRLLRVLDGSLGGMAKGIDVGQLFALSPESGLQVQCARTLPGVSFSSTDDFAAVDEPQLESFQWRETPVDPASPSSPVSLCSVLWEGNPIAAQVLGANTSGALRSHIAVTSEGVVMPVSGNSFIFEVPGRVEQSNRSGDTTTVSCAWFDMVQSAWTDEGCTTQYEFGDDHAVCNCTHLTDFSLVSNVATGGNVVIPDVGAVISRFASARFRLSEASEVVVWFLGAITVVAVVSVVYAAHWAHGDYRRQLVSELDQDETLSRGERGLWSGSIPATLGEAAERRLAQDESILAYHLLHGWTFLKHRLSMSVDRIGSEHPWLRPFRANMGHFDAPRRLSVLFCLIMALFLVSASLFRSITDNDLTVATRATFLICTLLLAGVVVRATDTTASYLLERSARRMPADLKLRRERARRCIEEKELARRGRWWAEPTAVKDGPESAGYEESESECADSSSRKSNEQVAGVQHRLVVQFTGKQKCEAIVSAFDSDRDGRLSVAEFNEYLRVTHPGTFGKAGQWTAAVFKRMLRDICGADTDAMDASALHCFYQLPSSPSFGLLDVHFSTYIVSVRWVDAVYRNSICVSLPGEKRSSALMLAVEDGAPVAVRRMTFRRLDRAVYFPNLRLSAALPADLQAADLILRRLQVLAEISGVDHTLPASVDQGVSPAPSVDARCDGDDTGNSTTDSTYSRSATRPVGMADTRPVGSLGDTTPVEPATRPAELTDARLRDRLTDTPEDLTGLSGDDVPAPPPCTVRSDPCLHVDLMSSPGGCRESGSMDEEPSEVSAGRLLSPQSGQDLPAPTPQIELRRSVFKPGSWRQERPQVTFETEQPDSADEDAPLSPPWSKRGSVAATTNGSRRRSRARLSVGGARIVSSTEPIPLGGDSASPFAVWERLAAAPRPDFLTLHEAGEVLRGEILCGRPLCALAIASHIARRGGVVPNVAKKRGSCAPMAVGTPITVRRTLGQPLGLILGGKLELLGAVDHSAADVAMVAARFIGRRLVEINGCEASLAYLREVDEGGGDVDLMFAPLQPKVGTAVALGDTQGRDVGGCLKAGTYGIVVSAIETDDGRTRVQVRRAAKRSVWESWYDATDLVIVSYGGDKVALQREDKIEREIQGIDPSFAQSALGTQTESHTASDSAWRPPSSASALSSTADPTGVSISSLLEAMFAGASDVDIAWLEDSLWQRDLNRAAWRVGVELVLEGRYGLAAAVFETVPLLLNPDIFFALHPIASLEPGEQLTLVAAVGRAVSRPHFGRLWVRHYLRLHFGMGPWTEPRWKVPRCGPILAGPFVTAVLGLQDAFAPNAQFGGASFHLRVEDSIRASWCDVEDLVLEGRLLEAAHVARSVYKHAKVRRPERIHREAMGDTVPRLPTCSDTIERLQKRPQGSGAFSRKARTSAYSGYHPLLPATPPTCADKVIGWLLDPFFGEDRQQPCFYNTIEYGRLLVLLLAERRLRLSARGAVLCMLRQERRAVAHRGYAGLQFAKATDEEPQGTGLRGTRSDAAGVDPDKDAACGTPNNNCCTADVFRANPYLTPILCSRLRADGTPRRSTGEAPQPASVRYVTPNRVVGLKAQDYASDEVWTKIPFLQLGRYLFPGSGSGLAVNPHRGVAAATASARVGDALLLRAGEYPPCKVMRLSGTGRYPVVFVGEATNGTSDPLYLLKKRYSNVLARRSTRDVATELPPDSHLAVVTPRQPELPNQCMFQLDSCRHIEVSNVRFRTSRLARGAVGIHLTTSTDVLATDCSFMGRMSPFVLGRWSHALEQQLKRLNVFDACTADTTMCGRMREACLRQEFASWVRFVGYGVALSIYTFLLVLTLFITAGFTDAEVLEWVVRSVCTLVFDVLILQPLLITMRSLLETASKSYAGGAEVGADTMADVTLA